jgi:type II secretory pathway pseudopilin PulG
MQPESRVLRYARSARGLSILEILLVVGLVGILSAMAVLQMGRSRSGLRGDGAMRVVLAQMRTARELAITERRYMRLVFTNPNQVDIVREEVPGPATTSRGSRLLEGGIQFVLVTGVPDTPDSFGATSAVAFGVVTDIKFSPDGTLVNENGQSINGSVFLAIPTVKDSVRAVTVLGSTGRIRGYRWDGANWRMV